jgi:lysophospholipase L1-like esterase
MIRPLILVLLAFIAGTSVAQAACSQTACPNLVFDGDSISAGAGAPQGRGLDAQVAAVLGGTLTIHNVAVGGRPVYQCLALYDHTVAPLYQPRNPHNIIVFHAGDNDISAGRNARRTYTAFTAYTALAHRQGWKVVVSTEFRRPDFPPAKEQQLELYNRLLLSNAAKADVVVNLDADSRFADLGKRSDSAVFSPDHIHPTEGGYRILAAMLTPAIQSLLSKP